MPRFRLLDLRTSRAGQAIGLCQGDIAGIADVVNAAQERLIDSPQAGETGWWGSWATIAYNVSQTNPYITTSRYISRLQFVDVCKRPVPIQNQFEEFLEFGIGQQPRSDCDGGRFQFEQTYDRGLVPTFVDLTPPNKTIRVYPSLPSDVGKRTLIQGLDKDGNTILSQDGLQNVTGEFLTLAQPFVQFPMEISQITGIQKDETNGIVNYYQVDLTTGAQTLLLAMEPGETVASYRRYFLSGLPLNCCHGNPAVPGTVQVLAMAKLALVPVAVDSDWLLIQSMEALIAECQAVRFSGMDSANADKKMLMKHREAIGFLQGQLTDKLGKTRPAVVFKPFGSATLRRQRIGYLT